MNPNVISLLCVFWLWQLKLCMWNGRKKKFIRWPGLRCYELTYPELPWAQQGWCLTFKSHCFHYFFPGKKKHHFFVHLSDSSVTEVVDIYFHVRCKAGDANSSRQFVASAGTQAESASVVSICTHAIQGMTVSFSVSGSSFSCRAIICSFP